MCGSVSRALSLAQLTCTGDRGLSLFPPVGVSTTAARRDTRGGRMQTESDTTCLACVLPERPSCPPPTSLFSRSFSFPSPYLLLSAAAISSCQTPGSFLLTACERAARVGSKRLALEIQHGSSLAERAPIDGHVTIRLRPVCAEIATRNGIG